MSSAPKPCKWGWDRWRLGSISHCRRHAPVVVTNEHRNRGFDNEQTRTEYPEALCPCGDYEVQLES